MEVNKRKVLEAIKEALDPDNYMGIDCLTHLEVSEDCTEVTIKAKVITVSEDNYIGLTGY